MNAAELAALYARLNEQRLAVEAQLEEVKIQMRALGVGNHEAGPLTITVRPNRRFDVKAAARVNIEVEWTDDGKVRRVPASDWIQHAVKATAMPAGPWVYNGSEYHEGKYVPEMCGDIIGILVAPSAVLNYPGADNDNGNIWNPFQKRVPPVDTAVTVIITPFPSTPVPPKP